MHSEKHSNRLLNETSPYLLQHAHNPVDWYAWGEEALSRAQSEDKPILVSIGYSACHWCHVMERESFEDHEVAMIMNENFINIKIDREERPDIDQIYMDTLQAMGQRGGWPLNVFLTTEGKPFYGGTYFPKNNWLKVLSGVNQAWKTDRKNVLESAEGLAGSISKSDFQKYQLHIEADEFKVDDLRETFKNLQEDFDDQDGGTRGAPKFPMPSIYQFLLFYHHFFKDQSAIAQVSLTLRKMAMGGIFDQLGGGFSRYSVDSKWFAPHFEKMLYDNGQLISLYSEAFQSTNVKLLKETVYATVDFLHNELADLEGGFYAALDADSEGVEGKYYVWTDDELKRVLNKDEYQIIASHYHTLQEGNWEDGNNILYRDSEPHSELDSEILQSARAKMIEARAKRIKPGLDNKILAGWNGIMLHGLVNAYRVFGERKFLELALRNARFLEKRMIRKNGKIFRAYHSGIARIDGVLEDYAFVSQGFISLYETTFDEQWLNLAYLLTQYAVDNFLDREEHFFQYTDRTAERLITAKKELFDNVIPSSNSIMAHNLLRLGILLDDTGYSALAERMVKKMVRLIKIEPRYLSNWASLLTVLTFKTIEIVIIGTEALKFRAEIDKIYLPNKIVCGGESESNLPMMKGRTAINGKTSIYVCYDRTCEMPVFKVEDALKIMREKFRKI